MPTFGSGVRLGSSVLCEAPSRVLSGRRAAFLTIDARLIVIAVGQR
jgi:hypothetical protein